MNADRIEAAKTAILAASKSASARKASPAMNNDMVKPIPASAPAPANCAHEYSLGFTATFSDCKRRSQHDSERLAYRQSDNDRRHQSLAPAERVRPQGDAGVREGEQRQHQVARSRARVAQQTVGRRFEAIVNRVERPERRRRRTMSQHFSASRRLGGDDRARLRRQAVRSGGGRVGMNSARMTPASVGCRPLASTHAHKAKPTTM